MESLLVMTEAHLVLSPMVDMIALDKREISLSISHIAGTIADFMVFQYGYE